MSAAANPLRERVSFEWNVATTVVLEGTGYQQDGRTGPEYRYFLGGNRIMWVPPEVHAQIQRLNAAAGSELVITRHKTGRNAATWTVQEVAEEPAQPEPATPPRSSRPAARPAPEPRSTATQQQRIPEPDGAITSMYAALCAAIRIASEAEKYAQQIGRPVAFETGDIRAMAASMYIHATGGR